MAGSAITIRELQTRFTHDSRDLQQGFRSNERAAEEHTRKMNNILSGIGKGIKLGVVDAVGGQGGLLGALLTGNPITGAVSSMVSSTLGSVKDAMTSLINKGFEFDSMWRRQATTLSVLSGSQTQAYKTLEQLYRLSIDRGLEMPALLTAEERLEIVGIRGQRAIDMIKGMTAASSLFRDQEAVYERIAAVFEKIGDRATMTGRDFLQLERSGVPVVQILKEMTGLSEKVLRTAQLNPEATMRILTEGWQLKFGQLAERRGQSLQGRMTALDTIISRRAAEGVDPTRQFLTKKLADVVDIVGSPFGEGLAQKINEGSTVVLTAIDRATDAWIKELKARVGVRKGHGSPFSDIGFQAGSDFALGFQQGMQQDGGDDVQRIIQAVIRESLRVGIAPEILLAQDKQESGFNNRVVSPKGARSFAQFMPDTGARFGLNTPADYADIDKVARAQAELMRYLLDKYQDVRTALAAYNAGEKNVDKFGGRIPPFKETQGYVNAIMGNLANMRALMQGSPVPVQVVGSVGSSPAYTPRQPGSFYLRGEGESDFLQRNPLPGMEGNRGSAYIDPRDVYRPAGGGFDYSPAYMPPTRFTDTEWNPEKVKGILDIFRQARSGILEASDATDNLGSVIIPRSIQAFNLLGESGLDAANLTGQSIKRTSEQMKADAKEILSTASIIRRSLDDTLHTIPTVKVQLQGLAANLPQSIGQIFGDAVRSGDVVRGIEKGLLQALLNAGGDIVQNEVTKIVATIENSILGIGGKNKSSVPLGGVEFGGQDFSGIFEQATTLNTQSININTGSEDRNTVALEQLTSALQQQALQTSNLNQAMQAAHGSSEGGFWQGLLRAAISGAISGATGGIGGGLDDGLNPRVDVTGTVTGPIFNPIHRAGGGSAYAGELYQVNENRTEYFRPYVSGEVLPLAPAYDHSYRPDYSRTTNYNYGNHSQKPPVTIVIAPRIDSRVPNSYTQRPDSRYFARQLTDVVVEELSRRGYR